MFTRRLFTIGRQLCSSNMLSTFQNPSIVQRNLIFEKPIEFFKAPVVEEKTCQTVINNVNKIVKEQAEGRLFAVIHLIDKQHKVTAGDIIVIEGYWTPTIGDKLRMEK